MYILNTTIRNLSFIGKVLLICVHNGRSGDNLLDSSSRCKVGLEYLSDTFGCVLLDFCDHKCEEFIPLWFWKLIFRCDN
jgi:hypothetical protein